MSAARGRMPAKLLAAAAIAWAFPATCVGLAIGAAGLLSGGRAHRRGRVLEFWGGAAAVFLRRLFRGAAAMTLGHVVLGRTLHDLERSRAHELVHVRQYERWGPFFLPAYLLCSLVLWCRGKDGYLDNPFEREAYDKAP
jgi:hypothetical protein